MSVEKNTKHYTFFTILRTYETTPHPTAGLTASAVGLVSGAAVWPRSTIARRYAPLSVATEMEPLVSS